jgi:hypothetical protein
VNVTNTFEIHSISTSKYLIHLITDDLKNYCIFGTIVPLLNVKPNQSNKVYVSWTTVHVRVLFFLSTEQYIYRGHVWYHCGLRILRVCCFYTIELTHLRSIPLVLQNT